MGETTYLHANHTIIKNGGGGKEALAQRFLVLTWDTTVIVFNLKTVLWVILISEKLQ